MRTAPLLIFAVTLAAVSAFAQDRPLFRVDSRLVEVYATIRDSHGHYLDGLPRDRFQVLDNGEPQPLVSFESDASRLSCAILIDTTGSMAGVLPVVKNSVSHMIDELREEDEVAIYSFNTSLNRLQEFTADKSAAKQAVLRTRAAGSTALFDAISELAREIAPRSGKKAIVVFTDGADNASLLNGRTAVQRSKKAGVPVYAIAEGEALQTKSLLDELKDVSEMTGGQSYQARKTSEIAEIFQKISGDLQHTYMLAYKPPPAPEPKWRTIQLNVIGLKEPKIHAKEGYLPE
jgi:Ca-activated chloride channel homolog